jgi:hypothetical protein
VREWGDSSSSKPLQELSSKREESQHGQVVSVQKLCHSHLSQGAAVLEQSSPNLPVISQLPKHSRPEL